MPISETITRIHAREVLDSRGNPTIEVEVFCHGGARGRAIVPSGASTGRHEAHELRDGDPTRYAGKGVRKAVANVHNEILPRLVSVSVTDQTRIDRLMRELDGTPNKSRLGANAILGVSLACAHAAADRQAISLWQYLQSLVASGVASAPRVPGAPNLGALTQPCSPSLPWPMINMISGGRHAGGNLDFQDFLLMPVGAHSFSEALEMAVNVYRALGAILAQQGFEGVLVGDEGGFGPRLQNNEQAIEILLQAIEKAGYRQGQTALAIDVAASQFFRDGRYHLAAGKESLSSEQMVEMLVRWVQSYPILSIEDGLDEDDWDGWRRLTDSVGKKVQLIGDDLFVTNPDRLRLGHEKQVANSILVKPNQIGTLMETLEVIALARSLGYRPVISARSGETEDTTIADLAVATGGGQIKIGSIVRGERLAKYNRLLRIAEELGDKTRFASWSYS
jgi:enolase